MVRTLHANEALPEEELARLQWERLTALIGHCYANVPYYRCVFDDLGAQPGDIRSPEDFARLPALDKESLRDHASELIATNYAREHMRKVTTGGSTGEPVQLYYDQAYFDWGWAALLRNMAWTGFVQGERQAWITRESTGGWMRELRLAIERKWVAGVVVQSPETVASWADQLVRQQPRLVYSTPSSRLTALATYLIDNGVRLDSVHAVMTSSETLLDDTRRLIERAFGAQVFNQYGSTECLSVAAECPAGSMHINADINYVEYQRVSPTATVNELVITPLFDYGMPLLRYRLKDVGEPVHGRCECGRTLPRMSALVGRLTGTVTLSNGTVLTPYALEELVQGVAGVSRFQFRQIAPDEFELLILKSHRDDTGVDAALGDIEERFERQNHARIRVDVRYVDDIPLTPSGKHLYVIGLNEETPH
jgi:phenylacetate-CoA ligase